uniref:Receptor kinase-like protein Xa21 n=1 Tax=Oryza nivara TaxID=4536 RepID=A0A0E0HWL3_ORYNI
MYYGVLCLLVVVCFSHTLVLHSQGSSNSTIDEVALFSFKSMLLNPSDSLASWNTSSHFCRSWHGVVCSRGHPKRVVRLQLSSLNLLGEISPFLGNLSFLRMLHLGDNHLTGQIPPELGHLSKLRVLNLSANSLIGSIPVTLGGCAQLTFLNLRNNRLHGEIPAEIGSLEKLTVLQLRNNNLSGQIPLSLGGLTVLGALYLTSNDLSGEIPSALGNLSNLWGLGLSDNMLSGAIPSSLGLLSRLSSLTIGFNNLSANASSISVINLGHNFLHGVVPPEVGSLRNLERVVLAESSLEAKTVDDWKFMTALANCSRLQILDLGGNKFSGVLPDSVSNLSRSLIYLSVGQNRISGSIPRDIGNLINLQALVLSENSFTGSLPSSLSRLKNLRGLAVYNNNLSGSLSLTIGNFTQLIYLLLHMNAFSGTIPSTLGNLTELLQLHLGYNNFTGLIPKEIFSIVTLSEFLDVSHNNLEGSIPQEIGSLKNLVEFHAESNILSGEIPSTLGDCELLQNIYLQNNFLNGSIPSPLSHLKGLTTLDISNNNLSGTLPGSIADFRALKYLNLSFNKFVGEVPTVGIFSNDSSFSIQGNDKLCGGIQTLHLPPCSLQLSKKKHKIPVIPITAATVATLLLLSSTYMLVACHKKRKAKIQSTSSMEGHPLISYSQLVRATNGFSTNNLLGSGAFGSVYKGELDGQSSENTNIVAVKVLKLQNHGALKSFISECEALRNLRHRNLVKIITACSSIDPTGNDFKAIVFEFMPNGNLESWLHGDTHELTEERCLNLMARVTILLDVAYALDYLHCHGPSPVIHCDIKSSNVLLDADMVAHVGDFGLARIPDEQSSVLQSSTNSLGFRGTIGYAAPEYGAGNTMSMHGDIYSYGILVLETITGKRPIGSEFREGLSLREYVQLGLQDRVMDVVDMRLSLDLTDGLQTANDSSYKRKIECIVLLLKLGMSCSHELPSSRLPTGDIIKELLAIKESLSMEYRVR